MSLGRAWLTDEPFSGGHFLSSSSSSSSTVPMDSYDYPELPTDASVAQARHVLDAQRLALTHLSDSIASAEDALAQIVADRKRAIREMQREQQALEDKVIHTLAYISPIRRLPHELLRLIFLFNFDNHPCCAWILASVCVLWRRLALSIPRLWSKVSPLSSMRDGRCWRLESVIDPGRPTPLARCPIPIRLLRRRL